MTTPTNRPWLAFAVLLIPVIIVSASTTALSFAMPAISEALEPTGAELLWIIDIYPLVLAGLLIPMGSVGDRFGRRRLLIIGAAGFTVISVISMFAPTPFWLIVARGIMAFFGSMLLPSTLALLRTIFPLDHERTRAVAIWTAMFAVAAALGPVLGGAILDTMPWEYVLVVGVPLAVIFLALGPWMLPESRDPHVSPIDVPSAALALVMMLSLVAGLKSIALGDQAWLGVALLALGAVLIYVFVRRQRSLAHPMVDLTLFRRRIFGSSLGINVLTNAAELGVIFFITLHLQIVIGMNPVAAGLAMLPPTGAMVASSLVAPRLVQALGASVTVTAGLLTSALGFAVVAILGANTDAWVTLLGFAILGLGLGPAWAACTDLIISSAPVERAGSASSLSETAYEVGAVSGTAIVGGIVTALYQRLFVMPAGIEDATAAAARETLGAASHLAPLTPNGDAMLAAATEAFVNAERITSVIMAVAMAIAGVLFLRNRREEKETLVATGRLPIVERRADHGDPRDTGAQPRES